MAILSDEESRQYNRDAMRRYRQRKKLIEAGLPIPPELEIQKRGPVQDPRGRSQLQIDSLERRRERNRRIVQEIKRTTPCADCDRLFPPVGIDFDHREGEDKIYGRTGGVTALMSKGSSVELLMTEIEKCELVCAVCHRVRTAKQNGWDESYYAWPESD